MPLPPPDVHRRHLLLRAAGALLVLSGLDARADESYPNRPIRLVPFGTAGGPMRSRPNGKLWEELTEAEHRDFPGDYEAQVSQGAIAGHSEEHLATSDRGIAMLRRVLQRQLDALRDGRDPAGVCRDTDTPPLRFEAGNYLERAA
jgi:hypothetical protein